MFSLIKRKRFWECLIDFVFPRECLFCLKQGCYLCPDCSSLIEFSPVNRCSFCQRFSFLGFTCKKCLSKKNVFLDGVFSFSPYNVFLKEIIHSYKYQNLRELETFLVSALESVIKNLEQFELLARKNILFRKEEAVFFYVPLHAIKLRYRGFNQSEAILKGLVEKRIVDKRKIKFSSFLVRKKFTFPQAQLEGEERIKNIKGAFLYKGPSLKKRNVFVLDDVSTSGFTLNECAKVLKKNGARRVYGIVVARR